MAIKAQPMYVHLMAWDTSANAGKTGDAANFTLRVARDGTVVTRSSGSAIVELDATNAPGLYAVHLDASDMNGDVISLIGKSATSNVSLMPVSVTTNLGTVAAVSGAVGTVTGGIGGNLVGNVQGGVTGAVGSVTGGVGGNVVGNLQGSVAGVVGSVVGGIGGNLVGNVGGSVTGRVGSVAGGMGGNVVGSIQGSVTGGVASVAGDVTGNIQGSVAGRVGSVVGGIGGNVVGNVQGSVAGGVASVAGAVGSVTGGIGGNIVGSIQGSVTGAVGSVVGGVGGNLVGNVQGSVAGVVGSVVGGVGGNLVGNVQGSVIGGVGGVTVGTVSSLIVRSGTCAGGTLSYATLDAGASTVDNMYRGLIGRFVTGGTVEVRACATYVGSSKRFNLDRDVLQTIGATTTYDILAAQDTALADLSAGHYAVGDLAYAVNTTSGVTEAGVAGSVVAAMGTVTVGGVAGSVALTSTSANAVADAYLDRANGIETSVTPRQALRLLTAVLAGSAVAGSGSVTYYRRDGVTQAITVTHDTAGNRTLITIGTL